MPVPLRHTELLPAWSWRRRQHAIGSAVALTKPGSGVVSEASFPQQPQASSRLPEGRTVQPAIYALYLSTAPTQVVTCKHPCHTAVLIT